MSVPASLRRLGLSFACVLGGCAADPVEEPDDPPASPDDPAPGVSPTLAPGIAILPRTTAISEAGDPAYVHVALTSRPRGPVMIELAVSDPDEARLSPTQIVFTPETWNVARAVEVRPVDDARFDGDLAVAIVALPAISPDPDYQGLQAAPVDVLSVDDDFVVTGYRTIPLYPDPTEARAIAINNRGQAVLDKLMILDNVTIHPFLWDNGQVTDLVAPDERFQSHALDLNDAGVVVGWSDAIVTQWVMYRDGAMIAQPGEIWTINDRGDMAGDALYIDGQRIPIHGDQPVTALSINSLDHVTGLFPVPPYAERAFFSDGIEFVDLGSFGGPRAAGAAVNVRDEVVGRMFDTEFNYQPFYTDGTQLVQLANLSGSAGGWANSINNRGDIVGTDLDTGRMPVRAWVGRPGNLVALDTLLVDSPCLLWIDAKDINDRGQIVGDAVECGVGTIRAYLFDPIKAPKPGCTP